MKKMWAVKGFVGGFVGAVAALVILAGMVQQAQATALTAERSTPEVAGRYFSLTQGSNIVYAGSIIVVNSSGTAEAATDAASKKVVGRCERTSDNTGANYSATKVIEVKAGVFRWVNGDTFTDANIGDLAYIEDDQTVQKGASATHDIIAGTIVDVDSDGVWVNTYNIGANGAASVTTLAASGAATLGSTLSVAGASTLGALTTTGATTLGGTTVAITNNATVAGTIVGSSTIAATGYKIGAVSGYGSVVTNAGTGYTNLWFFGGGLLTNVIFTGTMP